MLDHSKVEPMGRLLDVLCKVGVTTILANFLLLDIPVDRDVPIVVRRIFLHTCGAIMNTIKGKTSTFDGIVHQKFYVANVRNAHAESDSNDDEEYCLMKDDMGKPIYGPNHAKYLSCDDPEDKRGYSLLFDIKEPIYIELCHEFYSTYEFDEDVTDEELITNKLIKFRLGGCIHSLTLLEFAHRLGLYHSAQIREEGFEVYFQGGLRSDEHFNARDYWLSFSSEDELHLTTWYDKIQRNELWLMSMFEAKHQDRYANVAWLIAMWLKRKGVGSQRESMIWCEQFNTRMARNMRLLTDEVLDRLSAPIYCRSLDVSHPTQGENVRRDRREPS
ncbi:hypothetical protein Tco_1058248 [Tanacetum coccineum]|uniref:Uncharacterized protein n=1 Tax=Tanacetum coccineum TaxID=301880 RepID=A0ABQ5H8M0_9ASTR